MIFLYILTQNLKFGHFLPYERMRDVLLRARPKKISY